MSSFTLAELRELMRSATGVDEGVDLDGDISDIEFSELGYDSLAVLELASQIQRKHGVRIPDDLVAEMNTPAVAVKLVNSLVLSKPV